MNKLTIASLATSLLTLFPSGIKAQVVNPVLPDPPGDLTNDPGEAFGYYLSYYWGAFVTIGMIAVLLFFIWGAFNWITAGGDKNKVDEARNRMMNAVLGAIILASAYIIIGAIGFLIGIDLLNPTFIRAGTL